ncbi:hypothetical protein QLL95_gp0098 [Cotonvirus japonicus]|uniref:Uncharacterized protein n=1 Tax=Cotonvirus japonicus TaxID=2811091 RepID=A0ABM7NR71_9VIRU|nr:hypothetical protein QLL95_gp0098 [Cotonvirus japonicus]BCS82587.1 hypothetical protein [Cotonvirus japonicus]
MTTTRSINRPLISLPEEINTLPVNDILDIYLGNVRIGCVEKNIIVDNYQHDTPNYHWICKCVIPVYWIKIINVWYQCRNKNKCKHNHKTVPNNIPVLDNVWLKTCTISWTINENNLQCAIEELWKIYHIFNTLKP